MRKLILIILIILISSVSFAAELVIPAARRIDWTTAGVPGGIPTVTNTCTTDECNTLYAGTVTKASIEAAIASATTTDPIVIRIPSGTYSVASGIVIGKKNIILRGAGMNATILNISNDGIAFTIQGRGESPTAGDLIDITGGGIAKGATSFTTASVNYVNVGSKIYIRAALTADMMIPSGYSSDIVPIQPVVVTEVTGEGPYTVSFTPAAMSDFTDTPKYRVDSGDRNSYPPIYGIALENMTIAGYASSTSSYLINMYAWKSWIKNVKFDVNSTGTAVGIYTAGSFQCTIQSSWIDMTGYTNADASGIIIDGKSMLITDNILSNVGWGFVESNGGNGNVISYNYIINNSGSAARQTAGINANHGSEPIFNLYEGNITNGFLSDGYHGGSLAETLFRNNFHGVNGLVEAKDYLWRQPLRLCRWSRNYNVIGNILGSASWTADDYEDEDSDHLYDYDVIYSLGRPNMGNNIYYETLTLDVAPDPAWSVGNTVVGQTSGVTAIVKGVTSSTVYTISTRRAWVFSTSLFGTAFTDGEELCVGANCANQGTGYPQVANKANTIALNGEGGSDNMSGYDYQVRATLLRHKNYDYLNAAVTLCNDANNTEGCQSATNVAAEDTIPNSLYLTDAPSWWCAETTWPPIDPSGPTVSKIPAQRRYENLSCNGNHTWGSGATHSFGVGGATHSFH